MKGRKRVLAVGPFCEIASGSLLGSSPSSCSPAWQAINHTEIQLPDAFAQIACRRARASARPCANVLSRRCKEFGLSPPSAVPFRSGGPGTRACVVLITSDLDFTVGCLESARLKLPNLADPHRTPHYYIDVFLPDRVFKRANSCENTIPPVDMSRGHLSSSTLDILLTLLL